MYVVLVTSIMNMIERRSTDELQHPWVAAQPRFREARGHTRVWCSDEPRFLTPNRQFIQSIIHMECPESPYTPTHSLLPFALFGANPRYQCLYGYFTAYDTVHYSDVIMGAMACSDRWIPRIGANNEQNASVWWRHHACCPTCPSEATRYNRGELAKFGLTYMRYKQIKNLQKTVDISRGMLCNNRSRFKTVTGTFLVCSTFENGHFSLVC